MSDFVIQNGVLEKYTGVGEEVVIPKGITKIGKLAFNKCTSVTKVVIPPGVKIIGECAFRGCRNLKTVIVPDGVTIIEYEAFHNCKSLTDISIPDSVYTIESCAFFDCYSLVNINIPDGVTKIGYMCFNGCRNLREIKIPNGIDSIAGKIFCNCKNLSHIELPSNVDGLCRENFEGCRSLADVNGLIILNGVFIQYVGNGEEVVLPEGVTSIGRDAFSGCEHIKQVFLPSSLTRIEYNAFYGCKSLKTISIPDSVKNLDSEVFVGCKSLKNIEISYNLLGQLGRAFWGRSCIETLLRKKDGTIKKVICCNDSYGPVMVPIDTNYIEDYDRLVSDGVFKHFKMPEDMRIKAAIYRLLDEEVPVSPEMKKAFAEFLKDHIIKAVKLAITEKEPNYIRTICEVNAIDSENIDEVEAAVSTCKIPEIKSIIENHVKEIGFEKNMGRVDESNSDENDFIINQGVLEKYIGSKRTVTVPDGVTVCGKYAFKDCTRITQISLPNRLERIENDAFSGCCNLTKIVIPNNVKSIGYSVFEGCKSLKSLKLPENLLSQSHLTTGINMTLDLILHKADGSEIKTLCCLAEYDYIIPIDKKGTKLFDLVVAVGNSSGFKMTVVDRVKAALFRLADSQNPVKEELQTAFKELLENNILKAANCIKETQEPKYIQVLEKIGAINKENLSKVKKALSDSEMPEIRSAAERLVVDSNTYIRKNDKSNEIEQLVKQKINSKKLSVKDFEQTLKDYYGLAYLELPQVLDKSKNKVAPFVFAWLLTVHEKKVYGGLTPRYYAGMDPDAKQVLNMLDSQSIQMALSQLAEERVATATGKNMFLLYPICRYADESHMRKICSQSSKWRPALRRLLQKTIICSSTSAAIVYADKNRMLDEYAMYNGTNADTLRLSVITGFGLDKNGKKVYDLGDNSVTVSLKSDLSLELYDETSGKVVKSLPKKNSDSEKYKAAETDLTNLKKNVKKTIQNQTNDLLYSFRSGKKYFVNSWKALFVSNPILNRVAELIVWEQDGKTFTLCNGDFITATYDAHALSSTPISVAHPIEMKAADITNWQKYFNTKGLKQPFAQVWERAINPETVKADRYKDCPIPYYRFKSQEKHGIKVEDYDFHDQIDIEFEGCEADIERIDWHRHEILADDRFEIKSFRFKSFTRQVNHIISYLDKVTVWGRVKNDDTSVSEQFDRFTLAQIMELIQVAQENNAINVLALLMNYKNRNFSDFDPMDEFTLE